MNKSKPATLAGQHRQDSNPFKRVGKWIKSAALALVGLAETPEPTSKKEQDLPSNAFIVKHKLGGSFFTRQLNPKTRQRRISNLTNEERQIARAQGWIA